MTFDDKAVDRAFANVRKLLDLRVQAIGPHDAYREACAHLEMAGKALDRWRTERLKEPAPVSTDATGRRVPIKVMPAFQTAEEIKIVCGQLDAALATVRGLCRRAGAELLQIHPVQDALAKARKIL